MTRKSPAPHAPPPAFDAVQLAQLFPAYLQLDAARRIVAAGPVFARMVPLMATGDPFDFHFDCGAQNIAACANAENGTLVVRTRDGAATFVGRPLVVANQFFLALNLVPDHADLAQSDRGIEDYAPSDPVVPVLLLASVQKALLEETNAVAQDLLHEQQRNVRLFEHVRRVAGAMAHDFNNILSIIRLNVGRMREADSAAARARMVDIILDAVDRGAGTTQSFMTMSQQDHGEPNLLCVDEVIAANRALLAAVAGRDIELTCELAAPSVKGLLSKPGLLNSLFHLIVVARDAMNGHGRIAISTRPRRVTSHGLEGHQIASGAYVEIAVRTTGRTIPIDIIDRRVAGVYATIPDGGINRYASVQVFARQMQGGAWMEKARGAGTVVRILLPVQRSQNEGGEVGLDDAPAAAGPLPPRVLIVEDEPYALEALAEILADDFRVTPVASAREALGVLARTPHDVLLSDVIMPDMTGIELAREVNGEYPEMRIVLMSGYVPREDELAPDWAFVRKPIATDHLTRLLQAADS